MQTHIESYFTKSTKGFRRVRLLIFRRVFWSYSIARDILLHYCKNWTLRYIKKTSLSKSFKQKVSVKINYALFAKEQDESLFNYSTRRPLYLAFIKIVWQYYSNPLLSPATTFLFDIHWCQRKASFKIYISSVWHICWRECVCNWKKRAFAELRFNATQSGELLLLLLHKKS